MTIKKFIRMPRAVLVNINTKNFSKVLKLHRGIIIDYEDDITKYADNIKAKSLDLLFKSNLISTTIKLFSRNVSSTEKILRFPLYIAIFI